MMRDVFSCTCIDCRGRCLCPCSECVAEHNSRIASRNSHAPSVVTTPEQTIESIVAGISDKMRAMGLKVEVVEDRGYGSDVTIQIGPNVPKAMRIYFGFSNPVDLTAYDAERLLVRLTDGAIDADDVAPLVAEIMPLDSAAARFRRKPSKYLL
jgi:hypothetical protein